MFIVHEDMSGVALEQAIVGLPENVQYKDLYNLDGVEIDWPENDGWWKAYYRDRCMLPAKYHALRRLNDILHGRTGFVPYPVLVRLRGTVGLSELGMHVGIANRTGIIALANEKLSYAHVLTDDGRITDGCFTLFSSGKFSLS